MHQRRLGLHQLEELGLRQRVLAETRLPTVVHDPGHQPGSNRVHAAAGRVVRALDADAHARAHTPPTDPRQRRRNLDHVPGALELEALRRDELPRLGRRHRHRRGQLLRQRAPDRLEDLSATPERLEQRLLGRDHALHDITQPRRRMRELGRGHRIRPCISMQMIREQPWPTRVLRLGQPEADDRPPRSARRGRRRHPGRQRVGQMRLRQALQLEGIRRTRERARQANRPVGRRSDSRARRRLLAEGPHEPIRGGVDELAQRRLRRQHLDIRRMRAVLRGRRRARDPR